MSEQYTEEQVQAEIESITQGYSPDGEFFEEVIAEALREFYGYETPGYGTGRYPSMAERAETSKLAARRYPVRAEAIRRVEAMREHS